MALLALVACPSPTDRPERVLAQFLADVQKGRAKPAWSALSDESRRRLTATHEASAKARQKTPTGDPADILFTELRLRAPLEPDSIVVMGPLGQQVRLLATMTDGPSAEIWMVKEADDWKVDLVRSLVPTSTVARLMPKPEPSEEPQDGDPDAIERPETNTPSESSP